MAHTETFTSGGIRVIVADDHPAVVRGLERLIGDQPDMTLVGSARDALGVLDLPACDVAVLDYHLGERSGLWVTVTLKQRPVPSAVLLYSAFSDDVLTLAGTVAGADGVLRKTAVGSELCLAIRSLSAGERYLPRVPATVVSALASRIAPELRAAVVLLADGWAAETVAERLGWALERVHEAQGAAVERLSPAAGRGSMPVGPVRDLRRAPLAR